jgi:hypothetical protein
VMGACAKAVKLNNIINEESNFFIIYDFLFFNLFGSL